MSSEQLLEFTGDAGVPNDIGCTYFTTYLNHKPKEMFTVLVYTHHHYYLQFLTLCVILLSQLGALTLFELDYKVVCLKRLQLLLVCVKRENVCMNQCKQL